MENITAAYTDLLQREPDSGCSIKGECMAYTGKCQKAARSTKETHQGII